MIPPHSDEAEQSVIGAALRNRDAMLDAAETIKPDDFYDPRNREIFRCMTEMLSTGKAIDIVTVCDELKRKKTLEAAGGRSYVAELSASVPSVTNAAEYAKIVAERSALRMLIRSAEEIRAQCFEGKEKTENILDHAEKSIFSIASSRQRNDYEPLSSVLVRNIDFLNELVVHKGRLPGITTGFTDLDDITGGLHNSNLIVLAARPSMGKSAFALNVAENAAIKGGAHVLIFSLEMSKEEIGQRLLSMDSLVEMEALRKGTLERSDWEQILEASDRLSEADINIDDSPDINTFEIKNKCRRMKAEKGLDLVIVDHITLMHTDERMDNRQQEVSELSRFFKLLAREMDCPVLILSQLSREPEKRRDHRPNLADLRESGALEQDADIVLFLYRDEYYNKNTSKPGICEVNIAKHRNGPTQTIELTWVERYTRFADKAEED